MTNETKSGRPSRRLAIARMCKECIYDSVGGTGTWRQQIEDCTAPKCPLYPVRPLADHTRRDEIAREKGPTTPSTRDFESSRPRDSQESSTRCERTSHEVVAGTGEVPGVQP